MSDQTKFTNTWEISERSWLLKFYTLLYPAADLDKVNFCKLFWSVVLAIPMLIVWAFVGVTYPVWHPAWKLIERKAGEPPKDKPVKGEPSAAKKVALAIPGFFSRTLDRIVAFCQGHKIFAKVNGVLGALVGALFIGYWLFRFGAWVVNHWDGHSWFIVIAVTSGVVVFGLTMITIFWLSESGKFKTLGGFLGAGYHSVKYRTCPGVVIKHEETK